jgi:hypothetical protein
MSFANFEDFYEICCFITKEEILIKEMKLHEEHALMRDCIPESHQWWKKAVEELKKESELFYV